MNILCRSSLERVPSDFPFNADAGERFGDWSICEELATELFGECLDAQVSAIRGERAVDVLLRLFVRLEELGWGEPAELRWIVRRVAALLSWPEPDAVKQS
jgi:hypothetical protein